MFVCLFLTNCEKEEVLIEQAKVYPAVERLRFEELKQDALFNKISSEFNFENLISFDTTSFQKKSSTDFQVIKSTVNKLVFDNYATYTFVIERNVSNKEVDFENLIIEKKDSIYKIYTIGYLRDIENKSLDAINFKTISNSAVDIDDLIIKKSFNCSSFRIEKTWCSETVHYGYSGSCNANEKGETYVVITAEPCNTGGGIPDPLGDGLGNGGYDGTGNNSGGGDGFDNGTTTVPNDPNSFSSTALLLKHVLILNNAQRDWLNQNQLIADNILAFLDANHFSEETENFAKGAVEILSQAKVNSNNIADYESAILKMTNHLKAWGNPEDEYFAAYIESIVPDFNSMTVGDVHDIYNLTRTQVHELTLKYLESVVVPFAEAAYPFVVYALTEATLGAAVPLLSKLTKLPVFNSAWINKMVGQIGLLGVKGTSNSIRIVTTNGNAYTKSLELFKGITRNAKSINIQSNGARVADMGNGNFITFRPLSASSTGFEATITLDFNGIWSSIRQIKFK